MKKLILIFLGIFCCFQFYAQNYNLMTDPRDQQVYRTIQIGDQIWMADNLNYEMDNSYCYFDNPKFCLKYGRLYQLKAALKACPEDWHLASDDEWKTLEMEMGMKEKEANKTGYRGKRSWQGSKLKEGGESGMEIKFGGIMAFAYAYGRDEYNLEYMRINNRGFFWTSSQYEHYSSRAWARFFNESESINRKFFLEFCALSVRCIKDK
jgi:uncharacterized protein (TIGR02145 family)